MCGVWSPFLGRMMSPKTGLFLTFWKVNRRKSRRSGCLKKNTVLFKILGKNRKNCLSLSNCVISNPLEQKKLDIACFRKVLKTIRFKDNFLFHGNGYFETIFPLSWISLFCHSHLNEQIVSSIGYCVFAVFLRYFLPCVMHVDVCG